MAFIDYLWIIRLIIKILQVLGELDPGEKAAIAKTAQDFAGGSTDS